MPPVVLTEEQQEAVADWVTLLCGPEYGASVLACMRARDPVRWVDLATTFVYNDALKQSLQAERADVPPERWDDVGAGIEPMVALPHEVMWLTEKMVNRQRKRDGLPTQNLTTEQQAIIDDMLGDPNRRQVRSEGGRRNG